MKTALERFHAKTSELPNGCIVWTGCRQPKGYGKFGVDYVTVLAHRWIYEQTHGVKLDRDTWVLHSCDNPPCVNVEHLRAGTPADNHADMYARGRENRNAAPGSKQGSAKLTEADVEQARAERIEHGTTYRELAARYGVSISGIHRAIAGDGWRHVQGSRHSRAAVTRGAR